MIHVPRRARALGAVALCAVFFCVGAVQAEPMVHQVHPIAGAIDTLRINGSIDVQLVQGATAEVTINAPSDVAERIRTSVDGNTLTIDSRDLTLIRFSWHGDNLPPMIVVSLPDLKHIGLHGSANLHAKSWVASDELRVELTGSGDLRIDQLTARRLATEIMGSADAELAGTVAQEDVRVMGSGDYRAQNLKAGAASVSVMGSGDVDVWATQALSVSIAGSGDVSYYGTPTLSQSIAGSGELKSRGAK